MGDIELATTQPSFPSYAELTQTHAWRQQPPLVRADHDEAIGAAQVSQGSRYAEGAVLGTGGMGKVVLAHDARIGRHVAVKVLHADRELDEDARARFLREAQVQGQLEHPSIVPVYDVDLRADGTSFFTMRRVQGRTLSSIIEDLRAGDPAAKARYTERELLAAFATVCLTVDYAHSRGVVHRDLKPANIMLGDFGEVYVLDWGLARLVGEAGSPRDADVRLSTPGALLGTPLYMAPEQMGDPDVGPTADVYSLGLLLFEILTYQWARDPNALYVPVDARPSVRTPHRNVAPELEQICVRATALDPHERYPSARALYEALNRYLEGDREVAERRRLASRHVESARAALASARGKGPEHEQQRTVAMTELTRAVALDPRNEENVAMLAEIFATPPPVPPAAVEREYEKETRRIVRLGAKQGLIAMLTWVLAVPALFLIGVAHAWQFALVATPLVLTIAVLVVTLRSSAPPPWTLYVSVVLLMIGGGLVSCLYGPFVLAPMIIATNAIVLQAHPLPRVQRFAVRAAVVCMLGAILLEYSGILPRSYTLTGDRWTIVPQLVELPRDPTYLFLTAAYLASLVFPCSFVARLRNDLTEAQMRRATNAWHFKQLGARLVERDAG